MYSSCTVDGCNNLNYSGGLCCRHHRRSIKGQPLDGGLFWWKFEQKFVKGDGCWLWTGVVGSTGYGRFDDYYAHRLSYQMRNGEVPADLVIDHLCRTPLCVNPDHLEAVTVRENTLRGVSHSAVVTRTNRCIRDHEFTPANTYYRPDGLGRQCRACERIRKGLRNAALRSA